jgi:DNA-binding XRE family transcriptional regulator
MVYRSGRNGYPEMTPERFWSRSAPDGDCWIWTGRLEHGYGRQSYKGKIYKAHRLAWMLTNGAIPDGVDVCHRCDRPACVKPEHLFLASHLDNMRDMVAKGRSAPISKPGARNPWAKFSDAEVLEIRRARAAGVLVQDLADRYGVSRRTIGQIALGRRYRSSLG